MELLLPMDMSRKQWTNGMIRVKRSGMEPIMDIYPNATTEELIELCRKERRVELAFERQRYFDTRTWMIAEQTDNGPMYGMDTTCPLEEGMNANETPDGFWKRTVFETRVFKSNHYLYPFSQRELDRNKILELGTLDGDL